MEILNKSKQYKSDNKLVYSCQYHVIFCPKYRRPVLAGKVGERLKELVLEKQKEFGYNIIEMEVLADHIHLLIDINPREGVYKTVQRIKGYTSHTLREEYPELKKRLPSLWTKSKFISSVGAVTLEIVKKYIADQKK
jgi:putative transposase